MDSSLPGPEQLAKFFHEKYERLALEHGYSTRRDSRCAWEDVPEKNKRLMIATAEKVLDFLRFGLDRATLDATVPALSESQGEIELPSGEVVKFKLHDDDAALAQARKRSRESAEMSDFIDEIMLRNMTCEHCGHEGLVRAPSKQQGKLVLTRTGFAELARRGLVRCRACAFRKEPYCENPKLNRDIDREGEDGIGHGEFPYQSWQPGPDFGCIHFKPRQSEEP